MLSSKLVSNYFVNEREGGIATETALGSWQLRHGSGIQYAHGDGYREKPGGGTHLTSSVEVHGGGRRRQVYVNECSGLDF